MVSSVDFLVATLLLLALETSSSSSTSSLSSPSLSSPPSSAPYCTANVTKRWSNGVRGPIKGGHGASNVKLLNKVHNVTYFVMEVMVGLMEEGEKASKHCVIGISSRDGDSGGGGGRGSGLRMNLTWEEHQDLPRVDKLVLDRWHFMPYWPRHFKEGQHYVYFISRNQSLPPIGRYDLIFANDTVVPFFNVGPNAEEEKLSEKATNDSSSSNDTDTITSFVETPDVGADGMGSLNATLAFRTCLEYHRFKNTSRKEALSCGQLKATDGNGNGGDGGGGGGGGSRWELKDEGSCVAVAGNPANLSLVNVTVNASRVPVQPRTRPLYAAECEVETMGKTQVVRLRFLATGVGVVDGGDIVDVFVGFGTALVVLILALAALAVAYFLCPTSGVLCVYGGDRYAFLRGGRSRHLSSVSGYSAAVFRCSRFPISDGNTIVSDVFSNGAAVYDANGKTSSELDFIDDEGHLLPERGCSSRWDRDHIWPSWILEARLMRFPAKDVVFDETKPLGCGNYGYVFNGLVKVGFASFDVAIKQAKSVECEAQDELLREAEKLSKLRDHPNVVNIKGITLETAEDGLSRKYSLVLTLYTSGNLESYLRKNRETMSLDRDEDRMKVWAFQVASAMKFISDKGILHLDLATRNVLLTHPNEIAKISDFGLSKCVDEIDPDEKYGCRGLPIAWLPLEVWWSGTLSTHSSPFSIDVWSYGVLLWEIFTLGRVPYERELEEAANSQYFNNRRSQGGGGGGGKKATKHERLAWILRHGHRLPSPWTAEFSNDDSDNDNSDEGNNSSCNNNNGSQKRARTKSTGSRSRSRCSSIVSNASYGGGGGGGGGRSGSGRNSSGDSGRESCNPLSRTCSRSGSDGDALYGLMCRCWNLEPRLRPTFQTLVAVLQAMLHPEAYREQQEETDQERQKYVHLTFDNHEYLSLVEENAELEEEEEEEEGAAEEEVKEEKCPTKSSQHPSFILGGGSGSGEDGTPTPTTSEDNYERPIMVSMV